MDATSATETGSDPHGPDPRSARGGWTDEVEAATRPSPPPRAGRRGSARPCARRRGEARRVPRATSSALAADFDNYRKRVLREQRRSGARANARPGGPAPAGGRRPRARARGGRAPRGGEGDRRRAPHARRARSRRSRPKGSRRSRRRARSTRTCTRRCSRSPPRVPSPGSIVQVVQRGYRLGDTVIRPARVIVAGVS